jgi:membrane protease YdiL (CAAX protease family)
MGPWWWLSMGFGLVFPTAISWVEYLAATPASPGLNLATQIAYGGGKVIQFAFPFVFLWRFERRLPRIAPPRRQGLALGLVIGVGLSLCALGLYYGVLRHTALFDHAAANIHAKLDEFGLDSPGGFALFALYITVVHSLLEEYYWRWFVFGRLERKVALGWAIALSAGGFMVPHVVALLIFLGPGFMAAVAFFTLCVGAGGAVWAWLYHRSGSLYAPWLSHLLVDAALFAVGYDLFF